MKLSARIGTSGLLLAAFCGCVRSQAVTEYGSMASKTATIGKRAASISDNIGGVWGNLDKTVKGTPDPSRPQSTRPARNQPRASGKVLRRARAAAAVYEDPTRIQSGMGYAELIRRFGPGSYEVATSPGTKTVVYPGKKGDITVDLLDEKVSRVTLPAAQQASAAATK